MHPVKICSHRVDIVFLIEPQHKCEQYWEDQLDKPYDAGRGFSVVTTGYRGFADYAVRDMTVSNVSLHSPKCM